MRNNIDAITKIYQPPKNSSGTPPANGWSQIEKQFGITFPYDFKKIIETYGSGAFSAFLFFFNPFEEYEGYDYANDISQVINADMELKKQGFFNQQLYPQPNGLFPLAATDNGDTIYFNPSQSNDSSYLYLYDSRRGNAEVFNMSLAEFIAKWALGKLQSQVLETPGNKEFKPC
ncbi:SMI1/KNR4 family protein [Shewanella woodyi]|uniref:SMI1/KNR4 family protein n=1 Tax=Shewanella woodyi TaxID=60961 RepID=UPI0007F96D46|nr:SMI1/KNR4 family protein [Shewanella woodyi]